MGNKRQKTEGAATKAANTAPKPRIAITTKPAGRIAAEPPAKPAQAKIGKPPAFSRDDIALRAYFIAEKRRQLGLPGDAMSDWVEAETQLIGERRTSGLN